MSLILKHAGGFFSCCSIKLEKIVDADLHVDSAHEKAMKLRNILEGKEND